PTRIFLVEKFVMKTVSGKIDRERLPHLAHLGAEPRAKDAPQDPPANPPEKRQEVARLPASEAISPECEEVLAICRAVFDMPLGLDDGFAEAGAHSILIARLSQKLRAAGWTVPVRALLSDCNTVRKIANRPRTLQQASKTSTAPVKTGETTAQSDEGPADVLSIRYFTSLQVLFATLLYFPFLLTFVVAFALIDVEAFFAIVSFPEFVVAALHLYIAGLVMPFASLFWVMTIKF